MSAQWWKAIPNYVKAVAAAIIGLASVYTALKTLPFTAGLVDRIEEADERSIERSTATTVSEGFIDLLLSENADVRAISRYIGFPFCAESYRFNEMEDVLLHLHAFRKGFHAHQIRINTIEEALENPTDEFDLLHDNLHYCLDLGVYSDKDYLVTFELGPGSTDIPESFWKDSNWYKTVVVDSEKANVIGHMAHGTMVQKEGG